MKRPVLLDGLPSLAQMRSLRHFYTIENTSQSEGLMLPPGHQAMDWASSYEQADAAIEQIERDGKAVEQAPPPRRMLERRPQR